MFEKHFVAMRYWLLGKEYFTALAALEYASGLHTGVRKDGTTREFAHQLSIARYVRSLGSVLQHPEDTLAAVFLHDVSEDYGVSLEELTERFSVPVARAVWVLTRKYRGSRIPDERYFAELSAHPTASVVKGADRIHNVQTMLGVFTPEKQRAYVQETEDHVLPMLKSARRRFPRQEAAYENLQHMLVSQIELLAAALRANEPQQDGAEGVRAQLLIPVDSTNERVLTRTLVRQSGEGNAK